jgi:hypothetical protein
LLGGCIWIGPHDQAAEASGDLASGLELRPLQNQIRNAGCDLGVNSSQAVNDHFGLGKIDESLR